MKNLENIQKLAKMLDGHQMLTTEELTGFVTDIVNAFAQMRATNKEITQEHKDVLNLALKQLNAEHERIINSVDNALQQSKSDVTEGLKSTISQCQKMCDEVMAMKPKDGKNADEKKIVESVLSKIKLPEQQIITPEKIRDELESLEGEERLDIKSIKGVSEFLKSNNGKLAKTFHTVMSLQGLLDTSVSSPTNGQVLKYNSTTQRWENSADVAGSGTVTNIATGTGLTGGPITTTGTIELNSKLAPMDTLTGNSLKVLRVNAGETALEYATVTSGSDATITNQLYVDGNLGNDSTGNGSISKPFLTIQKALDYVGQPVNLQDAVRHIIINISGKTNNPTDLFSAVYTENLTVPNRFITLQGYGVKINGNILKEYSSSRRFGASSSEFRPTLTCIGFTETRDSHPRIRNGFHVGGTCRTSILQRNSDSITGNGTNKVTIHVTAGQFAYPITVSTPAIRIKVNGTTNYNYTYDITAQIDATTFEATRVSGTNASVTTETGSFFESDSAGASGLTHDSHFINTYITGAYTCDDGTVNGAAITAGTEILYSVGSRWFTGIEGRGILLQRWDNTTLAGASIVNSISGMNNCTFAGTITTNTFTYGTDDQGITNCRFNSAVPITVNNAGQTVRMDGVSYSSFVATGSSWVTNTPTISHLNNAKGVGYTPTTSANWSTVPTTAFEALDTLAANSGPFINTTVDATMIASGKYLANKGTLLTMTLPTTASVGSVIEIVGMNAGLWKIAQNASQLIRFGNQATTTGVGGSLSSALAYDTVKIVCSVANTEWVVVSSVGTLTVI